ncbi:MAG: ABC transporter ATP-binding protein [Selenomonadaceae bacterium]|nr:ABC transporter ATP-binding protein [Selenomonadaceae bacterium]
MSLLELKNVDISYGKNLTVKNCSLSLEKGEICSIVGESGSGKTTVIRAIMGLLPGGGRVSAGSITYDGTDLLSLTDAEWRALRGIDVSMIFQDSGTMMNQTRLIGDSYVEYIITHEKLSRKAAWAKGVEMIERMRLPDGDRIMRSYPFQLSGGQRQRVGIAMGMTYQPRLLLADEPTSALDVTTQAQIVRQFMELRDEYGTSIIIVTHNLGVAAYMGDKIVVMKQGEVVDRGERDYILHQSTNPYTKLLLDAVPTLGGRRYV